MLVYQGYLSFAEYKKHECMQIQEESNVSKVTLPMLVLCPTEAFALNSSYNTFMGTSGVEFVGWGNNNKTTKEYLDSLLVEQHLKPEAYVT